MKVDLLNKPHPDYNADQLEEYEFLYKGEIEGKDSRDFYKKWLPKKYKELDSVYQERIDSALYENEAGTMVDFIAAMLFSQPAQIEMDKEDPYYIAFLDNVDGAKTDINAYFREVFIKSLLFRNAYNWIDLPKKNMEPNSLGEQEALGLLNATLIPIGREAHYWQDRGKRLQQLLFSGCEYRRPTIADEPKTFKIWTYIDDKQIIKYEMDEDLQVAEVTESEIIAHGYGVIPVVRLQMPYGLWAMRKMRDPAVGLFRAQNRHDFSLDRTAYATPYTKTKYGDVQYSPTPAFGISLFTDEEAGYIEPKGTHFQYTEDIIAKKRDSFYRIMHNLALSSDSDVNKIKMSGESKKQDWKAAFIVLSAYAKLMRDHIKETLDRIAAIRGDTIKFTINGLEGWEQETLEELLLAMSQTGNLKSETYQKTIQKKVAAKVLGDEDKEVLQTVKSEIDAAEHNPGQDYVQPPIDPNASEDAPKTKGFHGED